MDIGETGTVWQVEPLYVPEETPALPEGEPSEEPLTEPTEKPSEEPTEEPVPVAPDGTPIEEEETEE